MRISELREDMNINCSVEEVEFLSKCIQNIKIYSLGTQHFFDSFHRAKIIYTGLPENPDMNILYEHFKNLNCIDLECYQYFSLADIIETLNN